jgi:hypothetical protein
LAKSDAPEARRSPRERIGQLVGTTRKARLITASTLAAIAVAVIAFIALKPAKDNSIPRDAYTVAADQMCLSAKREIVAVERLSGTNRQRGPSETANALLPVVATWRSHFRALSVPADRRERAEQLDRALRNVEIKIAELSRIAATGDEQQVLASAKSADVASTRVEEAASSLGLTRCAEARIGFSSSRR